MANITKINLITPDFLLCDIPIKNRTHNDVRQWVYCPKALSLIEMICVNDSPDFQFTGIQERFEYENPEGIIEDYFAVFTQNNCEATDHNPTDILKGAWAFYKDYLIWEDGI